MHGLSVGGAAGASADHAELARGRRVVALQAEDDGAARPREARETRAEVARLAVVLEEVAAEEAVAGQAAAPGDAERGGDVEERGVGGAGDGGGEEREGPRLGGGFGAEDVVPAGEVASGELEGGEGGAAARGEVGCRGEAGAVAGVGERGQGGISGGGGGGDQEQDDDEGEGEARVVGRVRAWWRHLGPGGGDGAASEISPPPPLAHLVLGKGNETTAGRTEKTRKARLRRFKLSLG